MQTYKYKNNLTLKQNKLVQIVSDQIRKTGKTNFTQAGLQVFETKNPTSAKVMTSQAFTNPTLREELEKSLVEQGITPVKLAENLNHFASKRKVKVTAEQVIKANVELLKLFNAYPDKKTTHTRVNFTAKVKDMDYKDAKAALERIRAQNNDLSSDLD